MAKKQTFEDKVNKNNKSSSKVKIKIIHANDPKNTGHLKFRERMYSVPEGKTPDQFAKELFSK